MLSLNDKIKELEVLEAAGKLTSSKKVILCDLRKFLAKEQQIEMLKKEQREEFSRIQNECK
jgi:hypothetical protein